MKESLCFPEKTVAFEGKKKIPGRKGIRAEGKGGVEGSSLPGILKRKASLNVERRSGEPRGSVEG